MTRPTGLSRPSRPVLSHAGVVALGLSLAVGLTSVCLTGLPSTAVAAPAAPPVVIPAAAAAQ